MSTLYIIATPIGNLKDITFRAIETLEEADLIIAEDTRQTIKLLNHYEIKKPLESYHHHSKEDKINYLIKELGKGKNLALVTDGGTPGIADPGNLLIEKVLEKLPDTKIIPIPGPSAVTTLLSISGINTDEFYFLGFLPHKKGRKTKIESLKDINVPIVIYESPYRIKKLLKQILEYLGDKEVIIGRELTKKFEETIRGKVSKILEEEFKIKGEFTLIIKPNHE
ncbi:16S rRNA (cytidine(1402)-2'-O)-methyltransferase [Patescibacteria group bacterium]